MISLRADGLGKSYRLYARRIDFLKEKLTGRKRHHELWALRGVDFCLAPGESMGVVGRNGAGKTTLLKLAAGTILPTTGSLQRGGRVAALLELGAGFHPELSGCDNVRLSCAVLGMSPAEAEQILPEIVAFAELEDAIDRPLRTYSTGMFLRLAFAVATSVDPAVLVVDEALAVGDQRFQKKCVDRMMAFRKRGTTLVFCSHNIYMVNELTERVLWVEEGEVRLLGEASAVTAAYQDFARRVDGATRSPARATDEARPLALDRGGAWFDSMTLLEADARGTAEYAPGQRLTLRLVACAEPRHHGDVHAGLILVRNDETQVYGTTTLLDGISFEPWGDGRFVLDFVIDSLPLLSGRYRFNIYLLDSSGVHAYDIREGEVEFTVRQQSNEIGLTRLGHRWSSPPGPPERQDA